MKKLLFFILFISIFLVFTSVVHAVYVNGYYRSNGTYVQPYYRSNPNGLRYDNYSYTPSQPLYNDSYYYGGHSSNWYQPAWTYEDDYWYGYDQYQFSNSYDTDYWSY